MSLLPFWYPHLCHFGATLVPFWYPRPFYSYLLYWSIQIMNTPHSLWTRSDSRTVAPEADPSNLAPRNLDRETEGAIPRGPVPLDWLEAAAACGGKALVVAVLLWFRRGVTGSIEVNVGRSLRDRFAVSQQSFRRALASLERAGLVAVERHRGRSPRITLLDPPTDRPP